MTAKSMTGYGKIMTGNELCDIKVEMKSVNSRYFDCNVRMPRLFNFMEITLKNVLKDVLVRGKVDVNIDLKLKKQQYKPVLRQDAVESYMNILTELKDRFGVHGKISLEHILNFNDILETEETDDLGQRLSDFVIGCIKTCAAEMDGMRLLEGRNLAEDIKARLDILTAIAADIDINREGVYEYWREKFEKRMADFGVDAEDKIVQEAAVMAEKADISEEITRIASHVEQFRTIIDTEKESGKKLDFMCQELNREFNTIGSKSGKTAIINNVVQAKSEIEKIREQVQNLV
ncbi:YicC/YloC family endoribonuclease [Seleniivibrio sp.]|uniref:YicC/YloC family endoribonuclease n=1 Tax=Seleniivibrio sp. TaxID=2898801 RepID=UPI0025FF334F|nr:YicC/YloC family endoribonuclease [Seleniivibrio sp.]MCD8552917.1 YicC family protein [Seleniivibrio sp.]